MALVPLYLSAFSDSVWENSLDFRQMRPKHHHCPCHSEGYKTVHRCGLAAFADPHPIQRPFSHCNPLRRKPP